MCFMGTDVLIPLPPLHMMMIHKCIALYIPTKTTLCNLNNHICLKVGFQFRSYVPYPLIHIDLHPFLYETVFFQCVCVFLLCECMCVFVFMFLCVYVFVFVHLYLCVCVGVFCVCVFAVCVCVCVCHCV